MQGFQENKEADLKPKAYILYTQMAWMASR